MPSAAARRGAGLVAVGIVEVAERTVDRAQAVGAAGDGHARQREVPLIARIVGVEAADDDGARLVEGRVVGDAEVHRLEPARGGGDRFDVGHAERRLDQRFGADPVREALGHLDLADDAFDRVDVGRHADLRDQDRVELGAGLLHDVDDVAVHVVRVEAVDADRDGLAGALPVEVVQRLDDVLARLLLVGRRDGVLAVEEDVVGRALDGAIDHGRVGTRNRERRALQALLAERVKRVAHWRCLPARLFVVAAMLVGGMRARGIDAANRSMLEMASPSRCGLGVNSSCFGFGPARRWSPTWSQCLVKYSAAAPRTRTELDVTPQSLSAISTANRAPPTMNSSSAPRWPMRKTLPATLLRPRPSRRVVAIVGRFRHGVAVDAFRNENGRHRVGVPLRLLGAELEAPRVNAGAHARRQAVMAGDDVVEAFAEQKIEGGAQAADQLGRRRIGEVAEVVRLDHVLEREEAAVHAAVLRSCWRRAPSG